MGVSKQMIQISETVKEVKPSATLSLSAKAMKMKAEGKDVVSLAAGEPDFPTPINIKNAAFNAIRTDKTKYTPASGIFPLRQAIKEKLKRDNGLNYSETEIVVTVGAKQALFNALMATVNPGDEVIIPAPCWVSYVSQVKLARAVPIILPTCEKDDFQLDVKRLERVITKNTKCIILNSPNNPSGIVYTEDTLRGIADLALKHGLFVISDEIYEKIVYPPANHVSFPSLNDEVKKRTILVNGVSKAYSMTGWRIGYAVGPKKVIEAMIKIQGHSTSNATSISQYAALEALNGPQNSVEKMRQEFQKRRDYVIERLKNMGFIVKKPSGSFYIFLNVSSLFGKKYGGIIIEDSSDLCNIMLENALVAAVPGSAFSAEGFVRLSYAASEKALRKAMDRIEVFVRNFTSLPS